MGATRTVTLEGIGLEELLITSDDEHFLDVYHLDLMSDNAYARVLFGSGIEVLVTCEYEWRIELFDNGLDLWYNRERSKDDHDRLTLRLPTNASIVSVLRFGNSLELVQGNYLG